MTKYADLSDEDLIMLMSDDELGAFCEIYERYWKKLYAYAYKRLKNSSLAEEVLQNFFVKFWAKRQGVNIRPSLPLFLFGGLKNEIIDYYRKESTRLQHIQSFNALHAQNDNNLAEELEAADLNRQLQTHIDQLPEKCRNVFQLSRTQHKSNKEIALELGISEKTVENQISKAIKRLRLAFNSSALLFAVVFFLKK